MDLSYEASLKERQEKGLPPLPLNKNQTEKICKDLASGLKKLEITGENLIDLLANRVPAGVDDAAEVKAQFLAKVLSGDVVIEGLNAEKALIILGRMVGGYNIPVLVSALNKPDLAEQAVKALKNCLLITDENFTNITNLVQQGNGHALSILKSWAEAEWFTSCPTLPEEIKLNIYKVPGEINTDDLSPAKDASTRPDIPLHALSMGESRFPDGIKRITELKKHGQVAFVADTLGTGSSRKSATNSLIWYIGDDIPGIPNKRRGGVVIASRIAPIFYNTFEDAGGLPIICSVDKLETGQVVTLKFTKLGSEGVILSDQGIELGKFTLPALLHDEWRAGGRVNLILGRKLTEKARKYLKLGEIDVFVKSSAPKLASKLGFSLAQKLMGKACGKDAVLPGEIVEPYMTTVASQDTTGPMTRDELLELACLNFSAPLVVQSFCHTAAYPNERDKKMQESLPEFFIKRGGLALKPGDGIIHSLVNRLLIPDTVGTGGDSHTRFPLGISFAAGSGLVALAAAVGYMPVEMPESVLVKFTGEFNQGITLRDLVNAIPLVAIQKGLLDRPGQGSKNIFNGKILEMEGLDTLTVEQGFELTCAAAERSAAATTIKLGLSPVIEYIKSNIKLLKSFLAKDYKSVPAIKNRIDAFEQWLLEPKLMARDDNAVFNATIDIDLKKITEPVLACPNNPDAVEFLSSQSGIAIDEVFVGSCMSNITHFRALSKVLSGSKVKVKRLWVVPPTRMDLAQLTSEGVIAKLEATGARIEIPGCSLCMGNQARVEDKAVVFSTSTRNFDNRMGKQARVYLGSAELAAVVAKLGYIPTVEEYFYEYNTYILPYKQEIYQPLYFHKLSEYDKY